MKKQYGCIVPISCIALIILILNFIPSLAFAQNSRNPCVYITQPNCLAVGYYLAGVTGAPMPVGGIANAAAPTFTEAKPGYLSFDLNGRLRTISTVSPAGTQDINLSQVGGTSTVTGGVNGLLGVAGNIASGVTDAGNPVKVGAIFNTTLPTFTNGQRGDLQIDSKGSLEITPYIAGSVAGTSGPISDGSSNTQTMIGTRNFNLLFNSSTWDRNYVCNSTAVVNVTAGNTTELVSLTASQIIRVCSFTVSMSVAGTAEFVYGTGTNCNTGTTSLTGAVPLAAATPWQLAAGQGNLFRTASANALCLAAVTGNAVGFVTYAKY